MARARSSPWPGRLLSAAAVLVCAVTVPRALVGRSGGAYFDGDPGAQGALAREVAAYVEAGVGTASFHTGSGRFDSEWMLVTHQMAALGLGQTALRSPSLRAEILPVLETCAERLLGPEAAAFAVENWGKRWSDALDGDEGHAYLGYINLALGMLRRLDPGTRFAAEHDRITRALVKRLGAAPHGLFETYPNETYPADVAAAVGSIGLHGRATGADHRALLARWAGVFRERAVDPRSGLLFQSMDARTGRPNGPPRASGTAISIYFLAFAAPALSRDLFGALRAGQRASFLGFGGIREYPAGEIGLGDIDSGPVLLGVGVSASGFALAGARMYGDRGLFTELHRTAALFGVPIERGAGRRFVSGGPLGNAILLAMMTAQLEEP